MSCLPIYKTNNSNDPRAIHSEGSRKVFEKFGSRFFAFRGHSCKTDKSK